MGTDEQRRNEKEFPIEGRPSTSKKKTKEKSTRLKLPKFNVYPSPPLITFNIIYYYLVNEI